MVLEYRTILRRKSRLLLNVIFFLLIDFLYIRFSFTVVLLPMAGGVDCSACCFLSLRAFETALYLRQTSSFNHLVLCTGHHNNSIIQSVQPSTYRLPGFFCRIAVFICLRENAFAQAPDSHGGFLLHGSDLLLSLGRRRCVGFFAHDNSLFFFSPPRLVAGSSNTTGGSSYHPGSC